LDGIFSILLIMKDRFSHTRHEFISLDPIILAPTATYRWFGLAQCPKTLHPSDSSRINACFRVQELLFIRLFFNQPSH
jgi:hypothetical protein